MKAEVRNGRLIVDEPTELPEGTVLDLVIDDCGDELGDDERRALDGAITKSLEQAAQGLVAPAENVLETLRRRRGE